VAPKLLEDLCTPDDANHLLHDHHHHSSVSLVIRLHVAQLRNIFIPSRENDYSLLQGIQNGCKTYPAYYVMRPCGSSWRWRGHSQVMKLNTHFHISTKPIITVAMKAQS